MPEIRKLIVGAPVEQKGKSVAKMMKCPKCKGIEIEFCTQDKKLSITKGLVGGALLGPIGAVAGGVMLGKGGKVTLHCKKCGAFWKQKLK